MATKQYYQFLKQWEGVMDLPPQTVGPFTPYYKKLTKRLKVMPWPLLLVGSVGIVLVLYAWLGSSIATVVSLLQRGF